MSETIEGHGFSVEQADITIVLDPISVGLPSGTKAEVERTTQGNTAVTTKAASTLINYDTFTHTFPDDTTDRAAWVAAMVAGATALHTITWPSSLGTWKGYCEVFAVGETTFETGARPAYDVTFLLTNLNGTTETAPAFGS